MRQNGNKPVLGIDIGGTKIAGALISRNGEIFHKTQIPTPQTGPGNSFQQIASLIDQILENAGLYAKDIAGIGIGIPAALEPETDFVLNAPNITGWTNVDLKGYLQEKLAIPTALEYDGHTAVLGEFWKGAGQGFQNVADVIIGTGIGAGFIADGRLIRGANRLAGAVGWQVLSLFPGEFPEQNETNGFWESCCSGVGIAASAWCRFSEPELSQIHVEYGEITAQTVFALAKTGNRTAAEILDQAAGQIGIGLANIISTLNPERIILGGTVGQACDFLLNRITASAKKSAQPISARTAEIVTSSLGTDAGLLGAAYGIILRLDGVSRNEEKRRKS